MTPSSGPAGGEVAGPLGDGRPAPTPRSARVEAVVAAARVILEADGAEGLTMRRLADAVGLRAPSLYKHLAGKEEVEAALVEIALAEVGERSHRTIRRPGRRGAVAALLADYRRYAVANPNLYRLATRGELPRHRLAPGLEDWAGAPWFLATGDPQRAQALWAFAHGMVILEIDRRFPPGSDLAATWAAGAAAFS